MTDHQQSDKGTYVLVIRLKKPQTIEIGSYGTFNFKPGWYTYAGSAFGSGGVPSRTARHLRRGKKHHWHVDYLQEFADIVEIWSLRSNLAAEHYVAQLLASMDGAMFTPWCTRQLPDDVVQLSLRDLGTGNL